MIESGLTIPSIAGALGYLGTFVMAIMAGLASRRRKDSQMGRWLLVAAIFLALACWRLSLGEIRLQDDLRAWAQGRGLYENRHTVQALLTLAQLASAGVAIAVIPSRRLGRSDWALGAGGGLLLFSFVRFVSLHQLDSLLYRTGPVHLNYVIDLGMTACAATFCWREIAWDYAAEARQHSGRRRRP